jgi:predicted GNAT family acetyltransferase
MTAEAGEVVVAEHPEEQRYVVTVDGREAGELQYHVRGEQIALTHTGVDPAFGGRGLAGRLVRVALDDAREKGRGVLPFCPYVAGYLRRHPDDVDLVPEARRAEFGL